MSDDGAREQDAINYGSYLALDELLRLQRPRSAPEHPDELLFIVVHQASELWFKAILRELDELRGAMARRAVGLAYWHAQRVNALMRIVSAQLSALETLPPQHFAQFRGYLGTSSGSQSVQFRAIEAASGLRDTHFMHALEEHGEVPPLVRRALDQPTLRSSFSRCSAPRGRRSSSSTSAPARASSSSSPRRCWSTSSSSRSGGSSTCCSSSGSSGRTPGAREERSGRGICSGR